MRYVIDIDGTICKEVLLPNGKKDYICDVSGKARFLGCLALQDNSVSENDNTSADEDKDV